MRLLIIRHADPDYENNTITAAGREEAKALAARLKANGVNSIVCSTLQRAVDTMKYTQDLTGISPVFHDWLCEFEWEGTAGSFKNPWDIPGEKLLDSPDCLSLSSWQNTGGFDGEKIFKDYKERIISFDRFLYEKGYERTGLYYRELSGNNDCIAIFCHAGLGTALISHLLNIPLTLAWSNTWLAPSSVSTIVFNRRDGETAVPRCISLGDTSHLYAAGLEVKPRGFKGNFY